MAYAVAILLVSALTTVGLLTLWAATSTAHWFWRTMGFLAAISSVLAIPAYDVFLVFAIQTSTRMSKEDFAIVSSMSAKNTRHPFFWRRPPHVRAVIFLSVITL
jgi:hypothetical protein